VITGEEGDDVGHVRAAPLVDGLLVIPNHAQPGPLTIVFAALAVSRWIEARTGWSIRKFVKTARRYKTIEIQAGTHVITAADPLPADLCDALDRVHHDLSAH
jgi:hypothetical protein